MENLASYTIMVQDETDDTSAKGKTIIERGIKAVYQEFLGEAYSYLFGYSSEDSVAIVGTSLYTPSSFTKIEAVHWKAVGSTNWNRLKPLSKDDYLKNHLNDTNSTPCKFIVEGTKIRLVPPPSEAGTYRVTYVPIIPVLLFGVDSLIPDRYTEVMKAGGIFKKLAYDNDPRTADYKMFYLEEKRRAILELSNQQAISRPKIFGR